MDFAFPKPAGISTYHTTAYSAIDISRPELSAANKTVFITGGGAGLGLIFAQYFARAGCTRIAITGRRTTMLSDAKSSLEKDHPALKVLALPGDVTDEAAVDVAFKSTEDAFGKIDILISNAGYLPHMLPITSSSSSDWWRGFEINVRGSFNILSSFPTYASHDAVIVNVVSAAVNTLLQRQSAYTASKVASTRLFESFQHENGGFRVVNVAPGIVRTDMGNKALDAIESMGLPDMPLDDISLPGSYMVWVTSPEAAFLKGKFAWVHWDVDDLRRMIETSDEEQLFKLGVHGMPSMYL